MQRYNAFTTWNIISYRGRGKEELFFDILLAQECHLAMPISKIVRNLDIIYGQY